MKHVKFRKTSLAAAIALVSGTMMLSGCNLVDGDKSNSTTVKEDNSVAFQQISAAQGTVVGFVTDSNGNAIAGAKVTVGDKSTTTDGQGHYQVHGVTASNVVNSTQNGASGHNLQNVLMVRVTPPASGSEHYLAGTVTVTPESQLSSISDDGHIQTIFVKNFMANAGNAVLPRLGASVTGVVRNANTGQPLANTKVSLDLDQVTGGANAQQPAADSHTISWQTFNYVATTDAEGRYIFQNLPEDSQFNVRVAGDWNTPNTQIVTHDEGADPLSQPLISVTPVLSDDSISPFVVSVNGVANNNPSRGVLKGGIDGTQGLTFNLSEQVDGSALNAGNVRVFSETRDKYLQVDSLTLGSNGQSFTLTLNPSSALKKGEKFSVFVPSNTVLDNAGNPLSIGATTTPATDINFDSNNSTAGFDNIQIKLRAMPEVTPVQGIANLAQRPVDPRGDEFPLLASTNSALADNSAVGGLVSQLNSTDNDDGAAIDTAKRLSDYAAAVASALGVTAPTGVETDAPVISFTPTGGLDTYQVRVLDQLGSQRVVNVVANAGSNNFDTSFGVGGIQNNGSLTPEVKLADDSINAFFQVANVENGWSLQVRELDELGNPGPWASVTLVDEVKPTTVLQRSYGANALANDIVSRYGAGGELSNTGNSGSVSPAFHVTPLLLASQANVDPANGNVVDQSKTLDSLYAKRQLNTGGPLQGKQLGGATADLYSQVAWANWPVQAAKVGVAFSEDVSLTGTAPTYNGTAGLSNYVENNDVVFDDQGSSVNADLITFDVNNVMQLAADAQSDDKVLSFAGAVQDQAAHLADAGANVVMVDNMPAFVTSAVFEVDPEFKLTVTFNELVHLDAGDSLSFDGGAFTATVPNAVDGNTVVFEQSDINGGAPVPLAGAISLDDGNSTNVDPRFVKLDFSNVEDQNGNKWSDYAGQLAAPQFLASMPAPFAVTVNSSAFTVGATTITLVYNFSHGVDMSSVNNSTFTYSNTSAVTSENVVSSNGDKTITVTYTLSAAVTNADSVTSGPISIDPDSAFEQGAVTVTPPTQTP